VSLRILTPANDGVGYAGDIAPTFNGCFALSGNQAGVAQLWHPAARPLFLAWSQPMALDNY
jgi:hypothetical protein